jgi:hypothetical protein
VSSAAAGVVSTAKYSEELLTANNINLTGMLKN